jgi:thiol:disulfide interchange protein DsbD
MLLAAAPTTAAPAKAPHMTVDLIAEASSWRNGQDLAVGVLLTPERGWHVYWKNAGDSGTAPVLTWRLPAGWRAGDIAWPAPQRITEGPLVSFGYTGPVLLIVHLTPPADDRAAGPRDIAVAASWLVCKDTCVPGKADLVLALPAGTGKPGPHASLFARTRTLVPAPLPASWMVTAAPTEKTLVISFSGTGTTLRSPVAFFPANPNEIENAAPQALAWGAGGAHLALLKSDQLTKLPASLDGVLVAGTRAWELRLPLAGDPPTATAAGLALWWALVLAFTGGMILNLMPCVFPVLSIKVLGFVRESMHHPHEVKVHGLLYGAGVIASFWALSGALFILKAGGEHLGWGFQLQSPMVIIILAAVLFLIGLNLFGVFETGTSVMRTAGSFSWGEGRAAAFFTGVLAVFLATPCTAPFMGTALGYAATQPIHSGFLVFTALGLGMAAPYVALSFAPHLGRLLPRPGRWMETFKHAMAFPLMATVIWLLWVLGLQSGLVAVIQALATMLAVAFAGWLYGRWHTGIMRGVAGAIIGVACIAAVIAVRDIATAKASDRDNSWERWSAARQERALSSGKPVFVDFTAAWCLTCKVNEVVALGTVDVRKAFKEHGVVMLQADWTNPDREIEKALAEFGRNGVPLYVLYPGGRSVPPVLLPQILTPRSVLNELEKLGGGG